MNVQRHELPNNTAEQVEQYLRDALDLVERLDVPMHLEDVVLGKAIDLLSGKQILMEQAPQIPLGAILQGGRRH